MNYKNYPIVKLLFPYLIGILSAYFFPILHDFTNHLLVVLAILLPVSILFYRVFGYSKQWIAGFLLQCCVMLCGISSFSLRLTFPDSGKLENYLVENSFWVVTVSDNPVEKPNSVKCIAEIIQTDSGAVIKEKAVLYFRKSEQTSSIQYGDRLIIHANLSFLAPPKNPHTFDYKEYMERKGIRLTGFVDSSKFEIIGKKNIQPVKQLASKIQRKLSHQFALAGMTGDEYSVITAILLGNDETMDPALSKRYCAAGVTHILCVSGMHVVVIFMILDFLLKPLNFNRKLRILKGIILLFSIWGYSTISGLAPSVQRAATMFTFVTIGNLIQRNTNVFHSLFASLFVLLLYNPVLLFDVGFQLSYEAVFGIVIFQKPLTNLWKPPFRIVKYFWESAAVSIAAQLGTLPHALYYFGQFPNYFLIANLLVVMLSTTIIISGIIVLLLSFSNVIFLFTAKILTYEIKLMNGIISFIDQLPGAVTPNINVHFLQLIVLLFIIFFLGLFVLHPQRRILLWVYGFIVMIPLTSFILNIEKGKEISVTCYALSKNSAITFNWHGESILLNNFIDDKANDVYQYQIKNHEQKRNMNSQLLHFNEDASIPEKRFLKLANHIVFHDQQFMLCRKDARFYKDGHIYDIDCLILCDGCKLKPEYLENTVCFKAVVMDESITPYYENVWLEYCREKGIACHSMRKEQSAYTLKME